MHCIYFKYYIFQILFTHYRFKFGSKRMPEKTAKNYLEKILANKRLRIAGLKDN